MLKILNQDYLHLYIVLEDEDTKDLTSNQWKHSHTLFYHASIHNLIKFLLLTNIVVITIVGFNNFYMNIFIQNIAIIL